MRKISKFIFLGLLPTLPLAGATDYYSDVKPLVEQRCQLCHSESGVSFSFENPHVVVGFGPAIVKAVSERRMPPWLAERGHRDYEDDYSLSDEEIKIFKLWQENKFALGDPKAAQPSQNKQKSSSFKPDLSLQVNHGDAYLPNQNRKDDYHCFMMKWPSEKKKYITGFRARPANTKVAHHLVLFSAPKELVPILEELEAQESGPGKGYQCFGGGYPDSIGDPKVAKAIEKKFPGATKKLIENMYWVSHWAPGMDGYDFPENTGIPVEPGSVMIAQMHYFSAYAPGESDQGSMMDFKIADRVEKPGFNLPITNTAWLLGQKNKSMIIPPHSEASYQHSLSIENFSKIAAGFLGIDVSRIESTELHSANLHMHAIGKSGRIYLKDKWGHVDTVLSVPRWDLNWQRDFVFKQAIHMDHQKLGDMEMVVECTFHNYKDETVYGGFGSDDEMCFNFSYFAFNLKDKLAFK